MNTQGVVRDGNGTVYVDIEYIRLHPDWYAYETTFFHNGIKFVQYRHIQDTKSHKKSKNKSFKEKLHEFFFQS